MTAMMRRNNTSRRVQTFSSDSIRSDEIAATDMALSRDWSRDGVSDMRRALHGREYALMDQLMAPRRGKINRACGRSRPRGRKLCKVLGLERFKNSPRSDHHIAIKFRRPIEMRDAPRPQTALCAPGLD